MSDDIISDLRKAIADPAFCSWSSEEDRQQSTQRLKDLCDQKTIGALIDRLDKADEMRDVLLRNGFVECDISACNCGSWHHRYGLPERMREIERVLADAGHERSNDNGHSILRALNALIARLDAAERENERLRRSHNRDVHYVCEQCGWTLSAEPAERDAADR